MTFLLSVFKQLSISNLHAVFWYCAVRYRTVSIESSSIDGCIWHHTMGVSQYCKHKWTIVTKQFIVLYLHHNGVKSRLKVYYRAQWPGEPVCSIISGHVIAPLCRKTKQLQHLQVRSEKVQVLGLLGDQLIRSFLPGSKHTRRPADTEVHFCNAPTTTLPSEGHQNLLVNAAFVLPWGGGGDRPRMCLYSPNNSPRWGFGAGVERADVIFQRGCCTPACFTFWVNKVWKSVEGLNAARWNVAHGGRTEAESSSGRWMHARYESCMLKWILSALSVNKINWK